MVGMSGRIARMRTELRKSLESKLPSKDWSFVTRQIGMFSFTGLAPQQVIWGDLPLTSGVPSPPTEGLEGSVSLAFYSLRFLTILRSMSQRMRALSPSPTSPRYLDFPLQVENMTSKWHVYMTRDGRISMAGLNSAKVDYLAEAMIDSFKIPKSSL